LLAKVTIPIFGKLGVWCWQLFFVNETAAVLLFPCYLLWLCCLKFSRSSSSCCCISGIGSISSSIISSIISGTSSSGGDFIITGVI
jgi:hypothetical protein